MIYRLHPDYPELFPDPEGADPEGLVAVGGDLSVRRLLAAYGAGIFPWYGEGQPLLWWSPDPRCVLFSEKFRIPHTVRKEIRKCGFSVTVNQAFCDVMTGCAATPRPDQDGTWIMPEMVDAYASLHELGFAHSVEVWEHDAAGKYARRRPVRSRARAMGGSFRRQTNGRSREISGSAEIRWKKAVCRTTRKRGKRS